MSPAHTPRTRLQYVLVAVIAFMLGSATIVSGAVKIDSFRLADGANDTQLAKVDANGNVAVSVSNTPSVNVANTPSVTIDGTPTVKVSRQPFQQFVSKSHQGQFGEDCDQVIVPNGMRLTIQSFSADVEGTPAPEVYILTAVQETNGGNAVRSLGLQLRPLGGRWVGDVQTLLISGPGLDPDVVSYSYFACISSQTGGFRGFVTGYLEPAQ